MFLKYKIFRFFQVKEMISLIFAMDEKYGIWKYNNLCWTIKEDLKFFSQKTKWKTVIMWKNTWNSLPEKFRPLPWRENIIISSSLGYSNNYKVFPNLKQALDNTNEVFLIWGKRIYEEGIDYADKIYITQVYWNFNCDVFFDENFIKKIHKDFKLSSRSWKRQENWISFEFLEYVRV